MQRFWIIAGSILTVVALVFATLNVVSVIAHEEVVESAAFDAAGVELLDVQTDNGTIEVVGADVDEISIVADISHGLLRTKHRAEVEDGTLVVHADCADLSFSWCSVDYEIVVPRALAVDADADNGRVTLRDLTGDVIVDSDNGRIELLRVSGAVRASTSNGSVEGTGLRGPEVSASSRNGSVRLTFAEAPTTVTARTSNGSVEVTVPHDDTAYRVELDTDHGSTDAGVRTDPDSRHVIVATTSNGSARVQYPSG